MMESSAYMTGTKSSLLWQDHAVFHGSISSDLEGGEQPSTRMQRSGFAGMNTEVRFTQVSAHYCKQ